MAFDIAIGANGQIELTSKRKHIVNLAGDLLTLISD
jgi:hypothetical protein